MLHQRYKDLFFWGFAKATLPNHVVRKCLNSIWRRRGPQHLHLGCGPKYLPNFVNVDANPLNKIDLWLDVRNGLPFNSDSIETIYCTHMIEHFYPDDLQRLF